MAIERFEELARIFRQNRLDRRRLIQTAGALGLSASTVGGTFSRVQPATAQESDLKLVTISHQQLPSWIRTFNPLLDQDSSVWPTQGGIYEPMVIYNTATGELVPWLATEWAFSEDNRTITFTLRDGVTWSDGEPFTSKDVKFTFDYMIEHEGLAGTESVRAVLPFVESVEAPDEQTVAVTFNQVYTPGLYDIGEQMIVPEHIWKDVADPATFTNEEKPIGTGPFTEIGAFQPQYYEILKNPNYWQEGKPFIDGFRAPLYPNNDSANLALVNGEVDMASNFVPDIQNTYIAKNPENFNYWFPAVGTTVHIYANTTKAPWDDPNVRKALSLAIDRDQIVQVAMYDYTRPADGTGLSDAYTTWRSEEAVAAGDWVTRDVARANELLDAAGLTRDGDTRVLPDGTPMSYDINVVSGWSDWVSTVQIIAQNLEEIGVAAQVQTYDFAAYFDRLQKGDFDLSIWSGSGGPTPFGYYRSMMATTTVTPIGELAAENYGRYGLEEADALLEQFASTSDLDEQKEIANQLQMLYAENAPAIPLFPGPDWGEFNTMRFTDFPSEENPYALLAGYENPERLIQLTTIKPVEE